jgi:uncharacterized RmlC-like cupin family protein
MLASEVGKNGAGQVGRGVTVVRAGAQAADRLSGGGRATAFSFSAGGAGTWIGTVTLPPAGNTGAHHHGRHEVAIFVAQGRARILWGEQLELAAEVGPGDMVYFAPYVPHAEVNLDNSKAAEFVVVRTDDEKILISLDNAAAEAYQAKDG